MGILYRLLICCVVAIPASAVYNALDTPGDWYVFDTVAALSFLAVAIVCMLLTSGAAAGAGQAGQTTKPANKSANKPAKKSARKASKGGREEGEVKWFNGGKGFGFISCDDGQELFVHFRSVRKDSERLQPGKRVEFAIVEGKKGAEADDVVVV